jgi:hypothetical protein
LQVPAILIQQFRISAIAILEREKTVKMLGSPLDLFPFVPYTAYSMARLLPALNHIKETLSALWKKTQAAKNRNPQTQEKIAEEQTQEQIDPVYFWTRCKIPPLYYLILAILEI